MIDSGSLFPARTEQLLMLDTLAVEHGLQIIQMMELAGFHVVNIARMMGYGSGSNVVLLCGKGNKGGDGLCAARHFRNTGSKVTVVLSDAVASQQTHHHLKLIRNMDIHLISLGEGVEPGLSQIEGALSDADLVVDAMIGYQLAGVPRGNTAELIKLAAGFSGYTLACDIPTGLSAGTGELFKPNINATVTVSYAYYKEAFNSEHGRKAAGKLFLADVGIPREVYQKVKVGSMPPFGSAGHGIIEIS